MSIKYSNSNMISPGIIQNVSYVWGFSLFTFQACFPTVHFLPPKARYYTHSVVRVMKQQYERIIIYGLPGRATKLRRVDQNNTSLRGSSLTAGSSPFHKLIISDTEVQIGLEEEYLLGWDIVVSITSPSQGWEREDRFYVRSSCILLFEEHSSQWMYSN